MKNENDNLLNIAIDKFLNKKKKRKIKSNIQRRLSVADGFIDIEKLKEINEKENNEKDIKNNSKI